MSDQCPLYPKSGRACGRRDVRSGGRRPNAAPANPARSQHVDLGAELVGDRYARRDATNLLIPIWARSPLRGGDLRARLDHLTPASQLKSDREQTARMPPGRRPTRPCHGSQASFGRAPTRRLQASRPSRNQCHRASSSAMTSLRCQTIWVRRSTGKYFAILAATATMVRIVTARSFSSSSSATIKADASTSGGSARSASCDESTSSGVRVIAFPADVAAQPLQPSLLLRRDCPARISVDAQRRKLHFKCRKSVEQRGEFVAHIPNDKFGDCADLRFGQVRLFVEHLLGN